MKKIVSIITLIIFTITSSPFQTVAKAEEKGLLRPYHYKNTKTRYTPYQYKCTYKFYLDGAIAYYDKKQYDSALLYLERALILNPTSEEAMLLARKILEILRANSDVLVTAARKKALEKALRFTKEKPAVEHPAKLSERRVISEISREKEALPRQPEIRESRREPYIKYEPKAKSEPEPKKEVARVHREPYIKYEPKAEPEPVAGPKAQIAAKPKVQVEAKPGSEKGSYVPAAEGVGEFYEEYVSPAEFNDGINSKIQQAGDAINKAMEPTKIKGEYRVAFGVTNDDFIWKDANADYHNMPGDTSWRYIFDKNRHNSYDKKIYSRVKVEVDNPINANLKTYNEVVVDPWTFVGKRRVFIRGANGDNVEMDLKYWSNAGKAINETYRTERGDIVNVNEIKIEEGKTNATNCTGLFDWGSNRFGVPEVEIDRMYVPLRKSWVEYDKDPYKVKLFLMADQEEALTSDDPMRLSNNKVWWEESPWLDQYDSSRVFDRRGISGPSGYARTREPLKGGRWTRNLSFVGRDSDDQYLTFLRGFSFNADFEGTTVDLVAAAPRSLWDRYDQADSMPAAIRVKSPITDKLDIGGLYTLKTGFNHNSVEAVNNLFAVDALYGVMPNVDILAEAALSDIAIEEAIGYENQETGYAGMVGLRNKGDLGMLSGGPNDKYELEAGFNHMNDQFYPGLSNYRFTRKDFEFAKHIYFDELRPENKAVKFGDGMDVGRNSFKARAQAEFPDKGLDTTLDFRTVQSDGGDFVENVYRSETTYKATPKLTLKGLLYYQNLPETTLGIDPLINAKNSYSAFTDYFAYEDVWLQNAAITAGEDPSIGAFSTGLNYDFTDYFSGRGIFELTNDPKDWPRGLLNNVYVTDSYANGVIWDEVVPFLYNQSAFGLPPYGYYGIYKTGVTYYPFKPIKVDLNYVYNENKYAMAIDDNSTHQGIEVEYTPNNRTKLGFLYQYTRQRDIYKEQVLGLGNNFDGHHNIFASLDYELNQDQHLTMMLGEYVGYSYLYPEEHNSLTALDTQHIIRVSYSGSWGEPKPQRAADSLDKSWKPLGPMNPEIPGASFVTNLYTGLAELEYDAEVADVTSDWKAGYSKLEFGIDAYDKEEFEGSLRFGLLGSMEGEEEWNLANTGVYQRNDASLRGADINANIGWALFSDTKYITVTPLLNAGYRRIEFERKNFSILGAPISQIGEADDVSNIAFLGMGGKLDWIPLEKLNLYTSGYWAPLVYTTYKNDLSGKFLSGEGNIWHAESGCDYSINNTFDISIGGFWDLQKLGNTQRINNGIVNAELPDSDFTTLGLKLGGLYRF